MKFQHSPRSKLSNREKRKFDALRDTVLQMDLKDVNSYVDSNVKNLAQARTLMKKLMKVVLIIAQKELEHDRRELRQSR